ncbi:MAG: hypothetical protein OEZ10_10130 [Gammaproteobacteria bacterium]|nr:hypothetical protein [Gammaproteobacteria bacterium]
MLKKAKRRTAKKPLLTASGKKQPKARKKAAKKTAKTLGKKTAGGKTGFILAENGLLVPTSTAAPVPASKLREGFKKASKEIDAIVEEITGSMTHDFSISEIELSASFSADGKFLGIGVGGAATIRIKIKPSA